MVVIIVYIVASSIIFYQWRRASFDDSDDSGYFGLDLMEMFYLVFTGGDSTLYYGVAIPFYILVVVFQCLILLNLIISIIGDTYGRVKEEFDIIDLREKINMLLEVGDEITVAKNLIRKLCCRVRRSSRNSSSVQPYDQSDDSKIDSDGNFLLVVEKYEAKSGLKRVPTNDPLW